MSAADQVTPESTPASFKFSLKAIFLLGVMLFASACSDSSPAPRAGVEENRSEVTTRDSVTNWQRYIEAYADPQLEISSGMVADPKDKPVHLISEYETKIERVVRLDQDGAELWSRDMPKSVHSVRPPAWSRHNGYAFVVQGAGLAALDDKSGEVLWESDGPNDRLFSIGKLVIAGDCMSSPPSGRWAVARYAATGEIAWKVQLPDDVEPNRITSSGHLIWILCNGMGDSASYIVDQEGVLVAKFDEYITDVFVVGEEFVFASNKRIARINERAEILWQVEHGPDSAWPFSTAEIIEGPGGDLLVYFFGPISDSGVQVWRLKTQSGEVVWKAQCRSLGVGHSKYKHNVYLKIRQDEVAVVSEGSWMFVEVLSADTGKYLDRFEFESNRE